MAKAQAPQAGALMGARNPGMMLLKIFALVSVVSGIVIYLANMFFPMQVVLGTVNIPVTWAIVLCSVKLGLITTFVAAPFLTEFELRRGRMMNPIEMMVAYFLVNFVVLWVTSRFSEIFGMGLSSWVVVLVLALVVNLAQGMAVMSFKGMMKS